MNSGDIQTSRIRAKYERIVFAQNMSESALIRAKYERIDSLFAQNLSELNSQVLIRKELASA
jgi:hypothetical protein